MWRRVTLNLRDSLLIALLGLVIALPAPGGSAAQPANEAGGVSEIPIGYIAQAVKRPIPLSRLNTRPENLGIAGARIALKDNNTTGKFTKQHFSLDVKEVPIGGDAVAAFEKLAETGHHFILVDAPAETLLALSDAAKGKDILLFNVSAEDVALRQADCRANVLHTAPDLAMLADALTQYLVWKQWQRWFVVSGPYPKDQAYLRMLQRAAKRFGARIVATREYQETPGARRSDTGQQLIQRQMPVFTQNVPDYDVLLVADRSEIFGPYLPYRSWDARPVAGTAGLRAMSWHPAHEQWGATQMQNRFQRFAHRFMLPVDYQAWLAVRAIGEAASRVGTNDFGKIDAFLRSDKLELAAFKGRKVSFRKWDGQMRQPIIVAGPELPVSVSPQEGFLHPKSVTDTLGFDAPESACKMQ
ncbi:ABC transporter substrate-binding protein [Methyloligella sp. GL2]|uniref:ABC transporter substrate-binding protein n=1 Tax=unclassified Methyloligella TaxID=2625955 RepID=UPI00352DB9BE